MSEYNLDEMYEKGHFKRGHSRKADQAILNLKEMFHSKERFAGEKFEVAWQGFLKVLIAEVPNISVYNLTSLELSLKAQGHVEQNLVICRIVAELMPSSSEGQCFLGHAYRAIGDLESAATCYEIAYELIESTMTDRTEVVSSQYLDACDYLCHLAETENNLGRHADALVHAMKAFSLMKESGVKHEKSRVYETLHLICIRMDLDDLAEHYRLLRENAKKSDPLHKQLF